MLQPIKHSIVRLAIKATLVFVISLPALADEAELPPLSIDVQMDHSAVKAGQAATHYVVVDFSAPESKIRREQRPLINLALVLDRSGSMKSAGKMSYAKAATLNIIDMLSVEDQLAIVEYDDLINVLWPSSPVETPELIKSRVSELYPRGSTNLSGGLMKGAEEVSNEINPDGVNRVILMSDGLANRGITDPDQIKRLVRKARAKGMTITTMGLGLEYDENLMQGIAEAGSGSYYYIESPTSISRIFRQEMYAMANTVASNAEVVFTPGEGVSKVDVFGYETTENGSIVSIPMEDFYSGEKRTLIIRLQVASQFPGEMRLGTLVLNYKNSERGKSESITRTLDLNVSDDQILVDASLDKDALAKAVLAEAGEEHAEVINLYEKGDIKSAKEKVAGLVTFLKESNQALGDISIEKKLEGLGMELEEMDRASSSTAERSKYLKSKKQQLFYASKGKQAKYLLQEGSLGMEVENLQQALKERDLYLGPIDGVFSSTLKESVIKYQSQNNLKADGIAGPLTLKALGLY
jgi:Ca-activated chloride channel family protein